MKNKKKVQTQYMMIRSKNSRGGLPICTVWDVVLFVRIYTYDALQG